MDKTIAGVLAAVGSLVPLGAAQAAVTPAEVDRAMSAGSFSDLLQSVPNAAAILKAADQQRATVTGNAMRVAYHHHHHHHHHWWYHHHHHHHWWWYHHHHHHHFF
jgi:hypothetical protein